MGIEPPMNIVAKYKQCLTSNAPEGLTELFNGCGCGASATENALKASFLKYRRDIRGVDFT